MTDDLAHVAPTGDRLSTLETLRDRLAAEIDENTDQRALAGLVLRFTDVLEQIDGLPPRRSTAPANVIAARRNQRRAAQPG